MVITTAFAAIRADLASVETLQWAINAFNLTFAVLLLTGAALGDRFGRRRVFAAGIALVRRGVRRLRAIRPVPDALIAARVRAGRRRGAGHAARHGDPERRVPARRAAAGARHLQRRDRMCADHRSNPRRPRSPASRGWRWIFWINLPIGLIAIALGADARLRESFGPTAPRSILPGLLLVATAALALVWSLLRGNAAGWTSAEVVCALLSGRCWLLAFVGLGVARTRTDDTDAAVRLAAVRGRPGRKRAVLRGHVWRSVPAAAIPADRAWLRSAGAGLRLLPWTSTLFVTAPIAGAVVGRFGERPLVVFGVLMQAIGFGWIAATVSPGMPYAALVAPLVLAGVGVSMAMPAAQNAILGVGAPSEMGKASGVFNMGRFLGAMFGIAALLAVFYANGAVDSASTFQQRIRRGHDARGVAVAACVPRRPMAARGPAYSLRPSIAEHLMGPTEDVQAARLRRIAPSNTESLLDARRRGGFAGGRGLVDVPPPAGRGPSHSGLTLGQAQHEAVQRRRDLDLAGQPAVRQPFGSRCRRAGRPHRRQRGRVSAARPRRHRHGRWRRRHCRRIRRRSR